MKVLTFYAIIDPVMKSKQIIELLLIALLSTASLIFFFNKGISTADEGYILHAAQRLSSGEIPYRDFNFIYTPGSLYIIALFFNLIGESVLSGKIIVLIIAITTSLFLYSVIKNISKSKKPAILSVLIYLAWGPSHINFPFPVIFCLFTAILSLYIFIKISESSKKSYYLLLGLTVAFTLLFKQNFGFALFFGYTVLFLTFKKIRNSNIALYFLSFLLGIATFYLYLYLTRSADNFFFYSSYAFQEYFVRRTVISPSPYRFNGSILPLLKTLVYLLPLAISVVLIISSLFKKDKIQSIAIAVIVGFYYLVGIYPSTDYVHISPLISIIGLPLAMFVQKKHLTLTILIYVFFLIVIIAGFYTAFFKGFYRWGAPIAQQKYYLDHPRIKVWSDNKEFANLVNYIQYNTLKNDYIYFYFYEPMFYFVSDRKNPIGYLDSFLPDEKTQAKYINSIENKKTKLVISSANPNTWSKSPLSTYIRNTYFPSATISSYTIWKRK